MPITLPGKRTEPIVICGLERTPRSRPTLSSDEEDFIHLSDAVDLVGEQLYGPAWLRIESASLIDEMKLEGIWKGRAKALYHAKLRAVERRAADSATPKEESRHLLALLELSRARNANTCRAVHFLANKPDFVRDQGPSSIDEIATREPISLGAIGLSDPVEEYLSNLDEADEGAKQLMEQIRREADAAVHLAEEAVDRWGRVRKWLTKQLYDGRIRAIRAVTTLGADDAIPLMYWRTKDGRELTGKGINGGVLVRLSELEAALQVKMSVAAIIPTGRSADANPSSPGVAQTVLPKRKETRGRPPGSARLVVMERLRSSKKLGQPEYEMDEASLEKELRRVWDSINTKNGKRIVCPARRTLCGHIRAVRESLDASES